MHFDHSFVEVRDVINNWCGIDCREVGIREYNEMVIEELGLYRIIFILNYASTSEFASWNIFSKRKQSSLLCFERTIFLTSLSDFGPEPFK